MPLPFLIIKSCTVTVENVEFVDIDYSSAQFPRVPKITATAKDNINLFLSSVTQTTARINFSQKYTGTVYYTAITTET